MIVVESSRLSRLLAQVCADLVAGVGIKCIALELRTSNSYKIRSGRVPSTRSTKPTPVRWPNFKLIGQNSWFLIRCLSAADQASGSSRSGFDRQIRPQLEQRSSYYDNTMIYFMGRHWHGHSHDHDHIILEVSSLKLSWFYFVFCTCVPFGVLIIY